VNFGSRPKRYRRLKRQISDAAAALEKRHFTRERAHAIWIERGRPHGRDVEF
jgi:hypothetical protein